MTGTPTFKKFEETMNSILDMSEVMLGKNNNNDNNDKDKDKDKGQ